MAAGLSSTVGEPGVSGLGAATGSGRVEVGSVAAGLSSTVGEPGVSGLGAATGSGRVEVGSVAAGLSPGVTAGLIPSVGPPLEGGASFVSGGGGGGGGVSFAICSPQFEGRVSVIALVCSNNRKPRRTEVAPIRAAGQRLFVGLLSTTPALCGRCDRRGLLSTCRRRRFASSQSDPAGAGSAIGSVGTLELLQANRYLAPVSGSKYTANICRLLST